MPRSSSPSPSITAMNPTKPLHPNATATAAAAPASPATPGGGVGGDEDDILNTLNLHIDPDSDSERRDLFFSDGSDDQKPPPLPRIDPAPHISTQFYTFNRHSHALMTRCILDSRPPSATEVRAATPAPVLTSWRAVWKDRNEDTAYLTAWKRIQDKLSAHACPNSPSTFLYFKSNPSQCVSHYDQWQDIVTDCHTDPDLLRHRPLKDTLDRIRRFWTVGAKFYGIPESFIRVCVASCQVCNTVATTPTPTKRRRFHYTETLEVPAGEVSQRLQQLACDHKAVLCIRQKYIRFKPFMAEVKDYACHRAGEAAQGSVKKPRTFVREKYKSKRCGCGFRIRAIVPITHYNESDKSFFYQEEGTAVFKLYAVHSGHEPGALDGNARIMHRIVGQKGVLDVEPVIYGVVPEEELENGSDDPRVVLQQVHSLKAEFELLEGKIGKMPPELLPPLSRELSYVLHRLRRLASGSQHAEEALVARDDATPQWEDEANNYLHLHDRMFSKDNENIEEEGTDLDSTLGNIIPWNRLGTESHDRKVFVRGSCEPEKWTSGEDHEESNSIKLTSHDGATNGDPSSADIQVEGYYQENPKWFDSPRGLEPSVDSGDGRFKDGGLCEENRQCLPGFPEEGRDL